MLFDSVIETLWELSPIPLTILWLTTLSKKKKQQELLTRLMQEKRLHPSEMIHAKLDVPEQIAMQYAPPYSPPPQAPPPMPQQMNVPSAAPPIPKMTSDERSRMNPPQDVFEEPAPPPKTFTASEMVQQPSVPTKTDTPKQNAVSPPSPPSPPQDASRASSISTLLGVGVGCIILAALIFVLTTWSSLSDFGHLLVLGAGSFLFFGASAIAHKLLHVRRTGTAFFILGAAYLPISIWAAGAFHLLGDGLAGAANPLLLGISATAFTGISILATRLYKHSVWSYLSLSGMELAIIFLSRGIFSESCFFQLTSTAILCAYCYAAPLLAEKTPAYISRTLQPFAAASAFVSIVLLFLTDSFREMPLGFAALLSSACFLAPCVAETLSAFSAFCMGGTAFLGFSWMFYPLHTSLLPMNTACFYSVTAIMTAIVLLVMMLSDWLPERTVIGYKIVFSIAELYACISTFFLLVTDESIDTLCVFALGILTAAVLIPALRQERTLFRVITAGNICVLTFSAIQKCMTFYISEDEMQLIFLAITIASFLLSILFIAVKPLRSLFSDILFPLCTGIFAIVYDDFEYDPTHLSYSLLFFLILGNTAVLWYQAMTNGSRKKIQCIPALLCPASLFLAFELCVPYSFMEDWDDAPSIGIWMTLSFLLGFLAYFLTKHRYRGVRHFLSIVMIVPALFVGLFAFEYTSDYEPIPLCFIAAAASGILWLIYASHGKKIRSVISFLLTMLLLIHPTYYFFDSLVFEEEQTFPPLMFAGVWILLAGIAAVFAQRKTIYFIGDRALCNSMAVFTPIAAICYSVLLHSVSTTEWSTLFLLFALLLCILGWLVTKPKQILLPTLAAASSLVCFDALHMNLSPMQPTVILIVCIFLAMAMFCYLGIVCHESGHRKAWSLTITGGLVPFWFMYALSESSWLLSWSDIRKYTFLIPLMFTAYSLHFLFLLKKPETRRTLTTIAGFFLMVTLWMQPWINTTDTYWDGKLHLIPLLAYGILLRYLYKKPTGSVCFFVTGVYSLIRLGIAAISTKEFLDLTTIIIVSVGVLVAGYFCKTKKWFMLGIISMICVGIYMLHGGLFEIPWWADLMLIGILFIGMAATNEICKQRGETLGKKAGRFLEDWEW